MDKEEVLEKKEPKEEIKENLTVNVNNKESKNEEVKNVKEKNKTAKHKQTKERKHQKKEKKKFIIPSIIILILLICLTPIIVFSILNSKNKNIVEGIKIKQIDVSNMNKEEAKNTLNKYIDEKLNTDITFIYGEYEINITPEKVGITFDADKAIEEAYSVGREENIFFNSFTILQTRLNGLEIDIETSIDEKKFNNIIEEINTSLPNGIEQPNYYINGSELVITSGKQGNAVDETEFKKIIYDKMNDELNSDDKIEIPVKVTNQNQINLDKIYVEIHKEAQDAYVTKEPFEVHPHVDGIEFEISMDEAKELLNEQKEEYKIPLKITKPSVTTDNLGDEAFPDVLATYSTKYSTADSNRSTNIVISANKINGVVLMPEEEFSYNKILGPRTPQAGYKLGAAYIGGKVVSDYGGGVCQTSSTLYNSVLFSNLEVVSRTSHYFAAAYVPIGRDATVYWPSLDFKFKNNRKYPIKIRASAINGTIKVDILGIKEDTDYEVELDSYVTGYVPFKTEYKDDNTLPEGKEVVEQAGSNGTRSETYKILKKDGKVVSKTLVSRDTYSGKNKIVRRGTKKEVKETKQENTNSNNQNTEQNNNQNNTQTNNNDNNKQQNTESKKTDDNTSNNNDNKKNET